MSEPSFWMVIGFVLASASVLTNDSMQTLGTFLSSNKDQTPKPLQMLFICSLTIATLGIGWLLGNGDPAWGRLTVPGAEFPLPTTPSWLILIPPLTVLGLTQWGVPVSTTFLILASFQPSNIGPLMTSSIGGYLLGFATACLVYGLGLRTFEHTFLKQYPGSKNSERIWIPLQWCTTGALWCLWLVQDLANVFVYLPRTLDVPTMAGCTVLICVGLCVVIGRGGGPVQTIVQNKSNCSDLRSATLIDLVFASCLLIRTCLSSFPISTTWIFLGLLAGREVVLQLDDLNRRLTSIGRDLTRALVGVIVSIGVVVGLEPLQQLIHN